MKPISEMSIDEVRDAIAEVDGWGRFEPGAYVNTGGWERHREGQPVEIVYDPDHPIPLTLDSAAACLPEKWWVNIEQRWGGAWTATASCDDPNAATMIGAICPCVTAPTELEARFRLALSCILADKGVPSP